MKNLHRWIGSYIKDVSTRMIRPVRVDGCVHVMFACVDHYEPDWNGADEATRTARVQRWIEDYPKLVDGRKDADGCHPRHSFFYPAEVYEKLILDRLETFCRNGYGEVEIHLHHDQDTEETLRTKLEQAKTDFSSHGFLSRRPMSGDIRYAFIHGNWALNNCRPDGRWCGVNNETAVLKDTGCYADYTFPSAPSVTQPKTINQIYYARSSPDKPAGHNTGPRAEVNQFHRHHDVLMVQGPLTLNWRRRKWGLLPRIENADLSQGNPPAPLRADLWIDQHIHVKGRPEWIFVKVHTHGAPEANADVLLGPAMAETLDHLEKKYNDGEHYQLHYVTAREMYNIIKAAEAGEPGDPGAYRDYLMVSNLGGKE